MSVDASLISKQLAWRYATKGFDSSKKISSSDWNTLEESLIQSPSSFGLQPWKFIQVESKEIREKLKAVSWNQSQITDASHLLVLARKTKVTEADVEKLIQTTAKERGADVAMLADYKQMMLGFISNPNLDHNSWTSRQVYIALGFFLTTAAMLSIDACPMEGFDPTSYDQILGLKDKGYAATVVVTAGYRSSQDYYAGLKKIRYSKNDLIDFV